MTADEFERAFRALTRAHEGRGAAHNPGCVACLSVTRCRDCTFCKRSHELIRCHYCVDAERCIDCNHCHDGVDLVGCTHCVGSRRCSRSAYLERCVDCSECHYCFGCVGLDRAEFHVLNEPYERGAYFALVTRLSRELAVSSS
ncbi:MAG: hypothetical protein AAF928_04510 [Myxococcota bacterium]